MACWALIRFRWGGLTAGAQNVFDLQVGGCADGNQTVARMEDLGIPSVFGEKDLVISHFNAIL